MTHADGNSFQIRSALATGADEVWAHVTTPAGINGELAPWLRMTIPREMRGRTLRDVKVGQPLGRSWLLLFGVVPIEYDDIALDGLDALGFSEASTMLTQRRWRHDRRIEPTPTGCAVSDRVAWVPRFPGAGLLPRFIVPVLFRHRHAQLRRRFGAAEPVLEE